MKICLVGDGNSIHIRRWAGYLKDKGHIVQMVSLTPRANHPEYSEVIEVLPRRGRFGYSRTIFPIRKAVKKLNPDICHGHYMTGGGFMASVSGAKHVITSAWGSDLYNDQKNFLKRQCIRYALKHSEVVMGDSDHILREVEKLAPKADTRKVIFGVDTELFAPRPIKHDKFRFLSIRTTSSIYRPLEIVKAFEKVLIPDACELWMFKPAVDSWVVADYVASRPDLKEKVVWIDRRAYDQMPELYNSVDCGISIPLWDSSSTSVNECMACAVPVIVSFIPQNLEWVNYTLGNGYLFDDKMPDNLTRQMEKAWILKDSLLKTGQRARVTIVHNADWNTEMVKAESIYKEVLNGKA